MQDPEGDAAPAGSSPKRRRLSARLVPSATSASGGDTHKKSSRANGVSSRPGPKDASPPESVAAAAAATAASQDQLGSGAPTASKRQTSAAPSRADPSPPITTTTTTSNVPRRRRRRKSTAPKSTTPQSSSSREEAEDEDHDGDADGSDSREQVHRLVRQPSRKHRRSTGASDGDGADPKLAQPTAIMPGDPRSTTTHRYAPTWRTASDLEAAARSYAQDSSSSSRSSNRPSNHSQGNSAARPASPASTSFTLSTGQPLSNPPPKTQAAFVGKLYSMLEDEDIKKEGLIYWSAEGTTFTCPNPTEFSKVLPRFFKHNNWQSFVRQLNMYSFNKVNDMYASSSDPQAWEFRHPLFRRGEPQLLASIKRKSTRTSAADSGHTAHSEADELERPGPTPAWMRDHMPQGHGAAPASNSARSPAHNSRPPLMTYAVHPGDAAAAAHPPRPVLDDHQRPASSRTSYWDRAPPGSAHSTLSASRHVDHSYPSSLHPREPQHPTSQQQLQQHQPPPSRDARERHPSATRPALPPYGVATPYESPNYPQPSYPSPVTSLGSQVSFLEDRLVRLSDALQAERIDNLRTNIENTSTMLGLLGWMQKQLPIAGHDLAGMYDALRRQDMELRARYDQALASDALTSMASAPPSLTRDERDAPRSYPPHHRPPSVYGAPGSAPPPQLGLSARHPASEPRPSRSAHANAHEHTLHTPRVSPSMSMSSTVPDSARLPHPGSLGHSHSRPSTGVASVAPPPFASGPPPSLPLPFSTSPVARAGRLSPSARPHQPTPERRVTAPAVREDDPMDDVKPTGLRNLLNPSA